MKPVTKKSALLLLSLLCSLEASYSQAQTTENLPDRRLSLPRRNSSVSANLGLSGGSIGPGTRSLMLVPQVEGDYNNGRHHADGNAALMLGAGAGIRIAGEYAYDLNTPSSTADRNQFVARGLMAAGTSDQGSPFTAGLVFAGVGRNMHFSTEHTSTAAVPHRGNYLAQRTIHPDSTLSVRPRGGLVAGSVGSGVFGVDLGVEAEGQVAAGTLGESILAVDGRLSADLILGRAGRDVFGTAGILEARIGACLRSQSPADSLSGICAGIRGAGQRFGDTGSGEGGVYFAAQWGSTTNPQAVASDADRAPAARPTLVETPAPVVAPVPVVAPAPAPAPAPVPVVAPAAVAPATEERDQEANEAEDAEDAAEDTDAPAVDAAPAQ